MPVLQVMLEVAPRIAAGLASGQLERVGGVIRKTSGKKEIVAWLREGGKIANNSQVAVDLLSTLFDTSTGGVVSAVTGVANAVLTAHTHDIQMQQLRVIQGISSVAAAASAAGIFVQIATTMYLARRISELHDSIVDQFEHDRRIKLDSALEYVEKIITKLEGERKAFAVDVASRDLIAARHDLKEKFGKVLSTDNLTVEETELASNLLLQGMQIDTAHVRIYLDSDEIDLAKDLLDDCLIEYQRLTHDFIQDLLGSNRARYFSQSVDKNDFLRFVLIEEWLRDAKDIMTDLVLENRKDFWNNAVNGSLGSNKRDLRGFTYIGHLEALAYAEILIENYARLMGYKAEIDAIERLGFSVSEWEEQISSRLAEKDIDLAEYNDYVLLIDQEFLDSAKRQEQMPSPQI